MRKQVTKITVHQSSKVLALLYFVLSALFVVPCGLLFYSLSGELDILLLFAIPFVYLAFFYVMGLIVFWVYNLIGQSFGGIEIEVDDIS